MVDKRIEWIDVAKGIGILLVILGHTFSMGKVQPLYAFHMPLFFVLSGLVISSNSINNIGPFVKRKFGQLIKPWFVVMLISLMVCLFIPSWAENITAENILHDLYTANTDSIQNSSLWYLPCLFIALFYFALINKLHQNNKLVADLIIIFVAIIMLFSKSLLAYLPLPEGRLPLKMDTAMLATVFIAFAYWNKDIICSIITKIDNIVWVVLTVVIAMAACYLNGWANMNSLDFGIYPIAYYPVALLGILSVCLVSSFISRKGLSWVKRVLVFYGRNTLIIFCFQSLFIRLYLLFFNNLCGLKMELYGTNPLVHQIGSFLIVAFVLSPITVLFFKWLESKNIKLI